MLVCWKCQNLEAFDQVSPRADRRLIHQHSGGLLKEPWSGSDDRPHGIYCAKCRDQVEGDLAELGLTDDRMDFLAPSDFRADELAEVLVGLRPDATWTRMELPPRAPEIAQIPDGLHDALADSLARTGRSQLFSHQSEAIERALAGEHVVQATPAGSGKSLGLVLPVLDRLLRDPRATALLVYPLKALANDQLAALERLGIGPANWADSSSFDLQLAEGTAPIRVARYDGSTPDHERTSIRRNARLLITTPDSLHSSILRMATRNYSDGSSWERILRGLRFVVLDELHSYQGVFGSAVGNVLRRLRRVTDHYGRTVQFLTASATIGNPADLAEQLTGVSPFATIDRDGSPGRRRVVLVCNPPERSSESALKAQLTKKHGDDNSDHERPLEQLDGGRLAPQTVAIDLIVNGALAAADRLPVRSISFCRSRNAVFQLAQRVRGALREAHHGDLAGAVAPYAATFLADDRVEAEGKLRDGSTLAIVSTNALELGIDIPDLSLAVLVGYPGQISSFRQRVGRAGRAGEGVAVLIVGDDPLQQHLARRPEALAELLDMPAESVIVNPQADEIARRYGLAPAQEELGGVAFEDETYFGPVVRTWLADASGPPTARHGPRNYWHLPWDGDPHGLGLRNAVGSESFTVVHQSGRDFTPVGVVDSGSAPRDAFVPAIWNGPDGTLYRITGFDAQKHEIYCEGPVDSPFQTRGITVDRVEITAVHSPEVDRGPAVFGYGQLAITRQVFSYKEQHFSGRERNRPVEKGWPAVNFQTDGLYIRLDPEALGDHAQEGSVRALEHLLLSVAPALMACDPHDIDSTSTSSDIFLYDSFGGDLRLTRPTFERVDDLLALAADVVASCTCDNGCPSCVMLSRRPDGNKDLSKSGAAHLLSVLGHTRGSEGPRRNLEHV